MSKSIKNAPIFNKSNNDDKAFNKNNNNAALITDDTSKSQFSYTKTMMPKANSDLDGKQVGFVKQKTIQNIWEDSQVRKTSLGWECLWCNKGFSGHNAVRVLSHLSGIQIFGQSGVAQCGQQIPPENLALYTSLAEKKINTRSSKRLRWNCVMTNLQ